MEAEKKTVDLAWGLHDISPVGCEVAVGSRCIIDRMGIDWVPDRRDWYFYKGRDCAEFKPAAEKLWKWLMKVCKELKMHEVDPKSNEQGAYGEGKFHVLYSPKSSYGYLYVTAWMDK